MSGRLVPARPPGARADHPAIHGRLALAPALVASFILPTGQIPPSRATGPTGRGPTACQADASAPGKRNRGNDLEGRCYCGRRAVQADRMFEHLAVHPRIVVVGWRGGTSPPRSRQTGREPLDSPGFLLRLARKAPLCSQIGQTVQREGQGLRSRAITAPSSLLHPDPPQCAASGTLAFSFRPRRTPVPAVTRGATARLVPEFCARARTTLMPPLRRTPPGQERDNPPGSSQGIRSPWFWCR